MRFFLISYGEEWEGNPLFLSAQVHTILENVLK